MLPEYFAYFTIVISLTASIFYTRDIFKGKVKPNKISWIFWGIAPLIGTYIGYQSGVSFPILASTFMAGFISIPVLIASFFVKESYWKITRFDIICGVISGVALVIWITTHNVVISLSFAILADLFAGIPTIIKSWQHGETENSTPYSFGIINQIITFLIITNFTFENFAFPFYLILANAIIIIGIKKTYFLYVFKKTI